MRRWILSAFLTLAVASPALAQQKPQPGQATGRPSVLAKSSPLAKITFSEPPYVLDDDGTFAGTMERIGKEVSRPCGAVENYAWEFRETDAGKQQQHAMAVYEATMKALEQAGYKVAEKRVRAIPDPETLVFTADRKDTMITLLWSPVKDAAILLICDSSAGAKPGKK